MADPASSSAGPSRNDTFGSWLACLVVLLSLGCLLFLYVPAGPSGPKARALIELDRAMQLWRAINQMAEDGLKDPAASGDWPGTWRDAQVATGQPADRGTYLHLLVRGGYLTERALVELLQETEEQSWWSRLQSPGATSKSQFKIYAVQRGHSGETIAITTQNFTYPGSLKEPSSSEKPWYVVVQKSGSAGAYRSHKPAVYGLLPGRRNLEDNPVEQPSDVLTP